MHCGGPLVNLDGQCVGINIARAERVSSYALPSSTARSAIESMVRDYRQQRRDVATTLR